MSMISGFFAHFFQPLVTPLSVGLSPIGLDLRVLDLSLVLDETQVVDLDLIHSSKYHCFLL